MFGRDSWTLNRLVVLLLLGAFLMLMLEIRYDHREVLGEHPVAWTPIVYSGAMLVAGLAALSVWHRGGREILLAAFAIGLVVGPLGFWFHNMGHPARGLARIFSAWTEPPGEGERHGHGGAAAESASRPRAGERADEPNADETAAEAPRAGDEEHGRHVALEHPPVLAPLSFFGLALLGLVACLRRFQREPAPGQPSSTRTPTNAR